MDPTLILVRMSPLSIGFSLVVAFFCWQMRNVAQAARALSYTMLGVSGYLSITLLETISQSPRAVVFLIILAHFSLWYLPLIG